MVGLLLTAEINRGSGCSQQQQQQCLGLEQTRSELLSNLTLGTAETRCFCGAGLALARLPLRVDDFITEFKQN